MKESKSRVAAVAAAGAMTIALVGAAAAQAQTSQRATRGTVELIADAVGGTGLQIAGDLSTILDDGATRRVVPVVGKGSVQNLVDLRSLRGIDMALVQTDVLAAAKNRRLAPGLEGAGTYIAKLYNEELHLLARPDVKSVQDLQGKKVNFGIAGGGTAVTAPRVFQLLKIPVEGTAFDAATAIEKVKSGEIAAIAFVAGKPAPLFIDPAVAQGLHLVPIPLQ